MHSAVRIQRDDCYLMIDHLLRWTEGYLLCFFGSLGPLTESLIAKSRTKWSVQRDAGPNLFLFEKRKQSFLIFLFRPPTEAFAYGAADTRDGGPSVGSGGRQIHQKLELDDFISVTLQRVELRGEMVDDLPRRAPLPTITITIMRGQIDFAFRSTCSMSTLQIGRVKVSLLSIERLPIGRIRRLNISG